LKIPGRDSHLTPERLLSFSAGGCKLTLSLRRKHPEEVHIFDVAAGQPRYEA